jgi:phospho-N-acetylmuramoyl-pentapeptide-transferase
MLYYLFIYLRQQFQLAGAGVFQYITFRASMAIILSLIITLILGKGLIRFLQKKQIGETVRDLGLQGEAGKRGTPTMGGLIIIAGIVIPTLLFAQIKNVYIWMMLLSTVWLGLIGFIDDYIKVFRKNKEGLAGRFKILGQIGLGIIIGFTMYYNQHVSITRELPPGKSLADVIYNDAEYPVSEPYTRIDEKGVQRTYVQVQTKRMN